MSHLSPECRELLLQTVVPVLRELIERGEEEDACIELLSSILEVLYRAQKVTPVCSAAPLPSPAVTSYITCLSPSEWD